MPTHANMVEESTAARAKRLHTEGIEVVRSLGKQMNVSGKNDFDIARRLDDLIDKPRRYYTRHMVCIDDLKGYPEVQYLEDDDLELEMQVVEKFIKDNCAQAASDALGARVCMW